MVRTALEMLFFTPDEMREKIRRERAMLKWFRKGADEYKYPLKVEKWNDDDAL
jgi:hypothetical protein